MPSNSRYTINNFSPDFRDAIISLNILTDTVKDNGLSSWLQTINQVAPIQNVNGPGIQSSPNLETIGTIYRESGQNADTTKNKINSNQYYTGNGVDYYRADIYPINPFTSLYYSSPLSRPTNDSGPLRDQTVLLNRWKDDINQYYSSSLPDLPYNGVTDLTDYYGEGPSSVDNDAEYRRDLNIIQNRYKGTDIDYERVSIELLPLYDRFTNSELTTLNTNPNIYAPTLEYYTENSVPETGPFRGGNIRQFTTARNIYLDVSKQTRTDLNSASVPTEQLTSYVDNFNSLGLNFDIRSSLAGRVLGGLGIIQDTRLGELGQKYLATALGYNVAFNIVEETVGRIDTRVATLLAGGNLIAANNRITVGDGFLGNATNLLERITGAKYPASSLDTDIFSHDKKGYIGVGNLDRANGMLINTGSGTVTNLFKNINANTYPGFTGNRLGYAATYIKGDDTNNPSSIYAFQNDTGGVVDFLNQGEINSPMSQSSYNLSGIINNSGFNEARVNDWAFTKDYGKTKFIWGDDKFNKITQEKFSTTNFKEKKSILYKTQELFNTNKMRTLVSGKGIEATSDEITTTTGPNKAFMSKGSGVLSSGGLGLTTGSTPDEIFARAWSPMDSYNQYKDLQKHSRLGYFKDKPQFRFDNVEVGDSVLEEFGMVKIAPYGNESIKKFMFSIENLAWNDELSKLIPCERGPGDPLTGRSGRIMWFPPYDIMINESTSASWDRTNFIGRGEPIYTYNSTERTGTLSFKIVVDHPNYLNFIKDRSTDEINSFFAGVLSFDEIRDRILSEDEKNELKVAENNKQIEGTLSNKEIGAYFAVFFPNDNNDVDYALYSGYENGVDKDGKKIDYSSDVDKAVSGSNVTTTIANGGVGSSDTTYTDNTNFGFNAIGGTIGDKSYNEALTGTTYFDDLAVYLENDCKYCKFDIIGYASEQGGGDNAANQNLAKKRGENLKDWLKSKYGLADNRFKKVQGKVITNAGCPDGVSVDSAGCKEVRQARADLVYDSSLEIADTGRVTVFDANEPAPRTIIPISRFYSECDYFEAIDKETDSFVYSDLKSKLKNFHPAFHAITPEGFNSRLTFLQQCMRQGPTTNANNPDNLAFGRPPVCILRIGDFYHTKIIIESLTIDYDPLVWDLNPEGVGVQPMIANINISFAFIGGSSMKGPINRLQNAISFNFFANTELYDPRAERIKLEEKPRKNGNYVGDIVEGKFPFPPNTLELFQNQDGIPGKNDKVTSQEAEAETQASEEGNTGQEDTETSGFTLENLSSFMEFFNVGESGKWIRFSLKMKTDENGNVIKPTKTYSVNFTLIRALEPKVSTTADDLLKLCSSDYKPGNQETNMGVISMTPDGIVYNFQGKPFKDDYTPVLDFRYELDEFTSLSSRVEFNNLIYQTKGIIACNNDTTRTPNRSNELDYGYRLKATIEGNGENISFIFTKGLVASN